MSQEDLLQSAYFALVKAVGAYDPGKGYLFISYLSRHIKNTVRDTFGNKNTTAPTPVIVYLYAPVNGVEDGSLTIGDMIEGEAATAAMERIQDDWERGQLRACLDDCIGELAPEEAAVIRAYYFSGKSLPLIANEAHMTPAEIRLLKDRAMRALRTPKYAPRLRDFLSSEDCKGYGLEAYKNRGYVSMVEVKAGGY